MHILRHILRRCRALLEDFGLALRLLQCHAALQAAAHTPPAAGHSPPLRSDTDAKGPAPLSSESASLPTSPDADAGQHDAVMAAVKGFGEMLDVLMGPPLYQPVSPAAPDASCSTADGRASGFTPTRFGSRLLRLISACALE